MPGRLASPRFRRRAFKGALLLAVVGAGALVSIFYWNTATIVETPQYGHADLYVPPIPIKMAAAERRQVIATAARFVDTAVKRDHAEQAYELVGPNLRNGTTLAHWREGDIPVVPYPVDAARWTFDYSYRNEIGLLVAVFPEAGETLRPMVFNMSLRAVGTGAKRHWLVDSWSPRGGGGSSARPNPTDGSPFRINVPQGSASTTLGAAWLLVPAGLIALALVIPATLVAVERLRSRRAQRAYERSL
jgi:hypothetical protein